MRRMPLVIVVWMETTTTMTAATEMFILILARSHIIISIAMIGSIAAPLEREAPARRGVINVAFFFMP